MQRDLTNSIKEKAYDLGFSLVGISPVGDYPESQYFKKWLNKGYEATMDYMSKNTEKRQDVRNLVTGARTVISCAINYNTDFPYSTSKEDKLKGWIARYAWGDDYHTVIKDKLTALKEHIVENSEAGEDDRIYVDTGPVLERMYAKYSGIGWIGKNTCLINQEIGSWLLIGELITSIELEYDNKAAERCGTCTLCIDSCPTDAITEPYVLDSSKCISYLTIENKGSIPREYREATGNNIFGCDICQDVCPWNGKPETGTEQAFLPRDGLFNPNLEELAGLDQEQFSAMFKNSPIKRSKRKGFIRNILVAIGNSGKHRFEQPVIELLRDEEPLIRIHAVWALHKISGPKYRDLLKSMLEKEHDEGVLEELKLVLSLL
jgi:epoxyqueuosine reductase